MRCDSYHGLERDPARQRAALSGVPSRGTNREFGTQQKHPLSARNLRPKDNPHTGGLFPKTTRSS